MIEFVVTRDGKQVMLGTTKRDAPAMSLFPALDREWVLWTPRGYYETSAIGDRRYLGWHRNRDAPDQPTDYFSFDHFERELRQPGALIRFLETADLGALRPDPARWRPSPAPPSASRSRSWRRTGSPRVQVVEPARPAFAPLVMQGTALPVRVRVSSEDRVAGRGLIRALRVLVDGGRAAEIVINPPAAEVDRRIPLNLNPGRHRVSVTAVNDLEKSRTESFDVIAPEPPRPPRRELALRPPQLVVLAIGADRFAGREPALPPSRSPSRTAATSASFLSAPQGIPRFQRVDVQSILGPDATAERILDALARLDDRRKKGELGRADSVFVVIESHLLSFGPEGTIAGAKGSVPASRIADTLGQLADYGCKVMLLVDAWHEGGPPSPSARRVLTEWARDLYRKNVITFVASSHGPSKRVDTRGHGAFAEGILSSLNVQGAARLTPERPAKPDALRLPGPRRAQRPGIDRPPTARPLLYPRHDPEPEPPPRSPSRRPAKELRAAID